ncbi:hypothetical protein SLH46_21340 [Draconibacterium sp. IB214405]|uniref:hypothetical protein n=1 Tax=Draconibacterium sp. IB214405 TaxID=3097352 RepID=UPI002A132080|nr:hypothetical protein [Draconibacterium sp. IB214405]MDX8341758.1 hypothetical protein [Draconibacterium sp. IB214405]
MTIYTKYLRRGEYISYTAKVVEQEYGISKDDFNKEFAPFNSIIRRDITVFFEYPYVDKFYRDSYYTYFSTKHTAYKRNSIRLSFFTKGVDDSYFRDKDKKGKLQQAFLGFITIRPTKRGLIGRSLISPKLYRHNNFVTCLTSFSTLINGVKLSIDAFPYCSQDTETISCAETTLLNTMEYFGSKYPEYSPVLPSKIIRLLSSRASERQLPSSGLSIDDISFVLKDLGFSPKLYSKSVLDNDNLFKKILDIYIESGIPIIGAIENDNLGHAVIFVGREELFKDGQLDDEFDNHDFNFSNIIEKYVLIDDNYPPYTLADYTNITSHYTDESFANCELTSFVVPLYPKIYVDAELALKFFEQLETYILSDDENYCTRLFLASSRSVKNSISYYEDLNHKIKDLIIETAMPKFVWVIEILDKESYNNKQIKGLIIIDATETNLDINDHLLFFIFDNSLIIFGKDKILSKELEMNIFPIFANNLKGRHNLWNNY